MSSAETKPGTDPQEKADFEAVLRHAFHREPLDPEVSQRIEERAKRITEEVYRTHGLLDEEMICALFRDDDEP